jgi:hypothetical protein
VITPVTAEKLRPIHDLEFLVWWGWFMFASQKMGEISARKEQERCARSLPLRGRYIWDCNNQILERRRRRREETRKERKVFEKKRKKGQRKQEQSSKNEKTDNKGIEINRCVRGMAEPHMSTYCHQGP